MFRGIRRKGQGLPQQECAAILKEGSFGVLALLGDGGYPYAVPLSYVYRDGKLYFHSAGEGHKVDALRRCEKASFCVVAQDQVVPLAYTTYYRSVIAFGVLRVLEGEEKRAALEALAKKYAPDDTAEHRHAKIEGEKRPLCMMELTVEHLSGKESAGLARQRSQSGRG